MRGIQIINKDQLSYLWLLLTNSLTDESGFCHCETGPAITFVDHNQKWLAEMWFSHGSLHREGGPAMSNVLGHQIWAINGIRHCETGPAVIDEKGFRYFLRGREVDLLEGFCSAKL